MFFHEKFSSVFLKTVRQSWSGILLYGERGVGKSFFVRKFFMKSCQNEFKIHYVHCSQIFQQRLGQTEIQLRKLFSKSLKLDQTDDNRKRVLIFDDFHLVAEPSSTSHGRIENLTKLEIKKCFDDFVKDNPKVLVIGITYHPEAVCKSLMGSHLIEKLLHMKLPNKLERINVFLQLLGKGNEEEAENLGEKTNGMTVGDLVSIVRNKKIDKCLNEEKLIPSLLRDYNLVKGGETGSTRLDELVGFDHLKEKIHVSIVWPFQKLHMYEEMGISPPRGILLYGPPGCGKTTLGKAIALEIKANFIEVQCAELISKTVGKSSERISRLFEIARASSPCVIFFDQFENIARRRNISHRSVDQMLSTLLIQMDGIKKSSRDSHVVVLAATNRIDMLDPAVLRPGRIDQHLYVGLPNKTQIEQIFRFKISHLMESKDMEAPILPEGEIDIPEIVDKLWGKNVSISDIDKVVTEASMNFIRVEGENRKNMKKSDFFKVISQL